MNSPKLVSFADIVHPQINFSSDVPSQKLILALIDTSWIQRLRDISQTANTRLVYMFSEHSRFGHSLGVAYLAELVLDKLQRQHPTIVRPFRRAVAGAALLHDIGHLAPGSHTAFKIWFPDSRDQHEELTCRIIQTDKQLQQILKRDSSDTSQLVSKILSESNEVPAWTWQIISGGGWNVDRGNWTIIDSLMSGVSYGKYNITALLDAIDLSKDGNLVLNEKRLDAMMHFVISRHAMYSQVYQHRVIMAADMLNQAIVRRAKELFAKAELFADEPMQKVLSATKVEELDTNTIFAMRESWWKYHIQQWSDSKDQILSDLARRIRDRRLFKTIRLLKGEEKEKTTQAKEALEKLNLPPKYYLHLINTKDVHAGDEHQSLSVLNEDNSLTPLAKADPLFETLTKHSKTSRKSWLALPQEAKEILS